MYYHCIKKGKMYHCLKRNKITPVCERIYFKLKFETNIKLKWIPRGIKYKIEKGDDYIFVDYLKTEDDHIHTFKYSNCSKNMNEFFDGTDGVFIEINCDTQHREKQNIKLVLHSRISDNVLDL